MSPGELVCFDDVPHSSSSARAEKKETKPLRPRAGDHARQRVLVRRHQGKASLLIQRCASCGRLRHPTGTGVARAVRPYEWDTVEASGRGTIYSFVVNHYPQGPGVRLPAAGRSDRARGRQPASSPTIVGRRRG